GHLHPLAGRPRTRPTPRHITGARPLPRQPHRDRSRGDRRLRGQLDGPRLRDANGLELAFVPELAIALLAREPLLRGPGIQEGLHLREDALLPRVVGAPLVRRDYGGPRPRRAHEEI